MGHPLEVTYPLTGALPAGAYHLVADGLIVNTPNVEFDLLWRQKGGAQTPIAIFTHQYPAGSTAQYEDSATAARMPAQPGDELVFKITVLGPSATSEWLPISEQPPTPTARFTTIDLP